MTASVSTCSSSHTCMLNLLLFILTYSYLSYTAQSLFQKNNLGSGTCLNYFSSLSNVFSMPDPVICQAVCLQTVKGFLTVKAVRATINVSNISYKSCTLLQYAKKSIYSKYLYFYKEIFLPDLPNLGAQIRCAKICILLSKQT